MAIAPRGFLHLWVQQALPRRARPGVRLAHGARRPERRRGPDPHDEPAGDLDLFSLPVDQAMVEQALQGRVTSLSQAFAYWLARRWRR